MRNTCTARTSVPARIWGDPTRWRQVLTNLLGNAMGKAVSGAIAQMVQNMGMPNTTGNLIKQIVGEVIERGVRVRAEPA